MGVFYQNYHLTKVTFFSYPLSQNYLLSNSIFSHYSLLGEDIQQAQRVPPLVVAHIPLGECMKEEGILPSQV